MHNQIVAYPAGEYNGNQGNYQQLSLALHTAHKPQIVSIPGASPKQRDRYRVVLGERILADKLTLDEALKVAKRGGK